MSEPPEKPSNPFLKPATTKGSIFGGQTTTGTSRIFGGAAATTTSAGLFGGATVKSLSTDPRSSSNASEFRASNTGANADSIGTTGVTTFGSAINSAIKNAFTNTHSLFGATSDSQSVFGGKPTSEAKPETSTIKSSNIFSLPLKPVVNVHSLFGNASSTSDTIKSIPTTGNPSFGTSAQFSSVLPATSSSTATVSSTSLFGNSSNSLVSSSSLFQKSSVDAAPVSTANPFVNVITKNANIHSRPSEQIVSHEQNLARPSEINQGLQSNSSLPERSTLVSSGSSSIPTVFQAKFSNPGTENLFTSSLSNKAPPSYSDTFSKSSSAQIKEEGWSEQEANASCSDNQKGNKMVSSDNYFDEILDVPIPSPPSDNFTTGLKKMEPTGIICTCINEDYLDQNILRNHFAKFGTVTNVSIKKMSNQAIVNFTSHASASQARRLGKMLHPNLPKMMILFDYSSKSSLDADKARRIKNNAVKFLRQNSVENLSKTRKLSQENTDETVKSTKANPNVVRSSVIEAAARRDSHQAFPALSRSTDSVNRLAKDLDVSVPVVNAANFAALAKVKAHTSHEKYSLLDARDKLIRKQQTKVLDVKKAKYLSATCSDMCPEKERYMREVQNDLSSYEMTSDRKVDHKRAVKKFSRSSADKHEPLPHELRTGAVLKQTMDYLMCNIMPDLEENSKKDVDLCYNFVWDRTRAMRSDVMQQHLLDKTAVYVLERCVRFHIYCAERLCLESPDVFDPKMNAEHLSKSLHSLKELYHDLSVSSIYVDSEAEFRAYELLLNIDDGNIMFAYLHFRDVVRKSPEVQFAVKVLHAIQTNNYVRFFRLVREATFLQACILHRYFTRVRSKALIILTKAFYTPSGKWQSISLSKLTRLLQFEGPDDASSFLVSHGLVINAHGRVVLDRSKFIARPAETPPLSRALNVVGSKRVRSVGEEINGGSLPDNPLYFHQPCNSFTPDGYLIAAALSNEIGKSSLDDSHSSLLRSASDCEAPTTSSIHCHSIEDYVLEDKTDASQSSDVAENPVPCELTPEHIGYDELSQESVSRDPNEDLSQGGQHFEELGEAENIVSNSCIDEEGELVFSSQNEEAVEDADGNCGYEGVAEGDEAMFEDDYVEPSLHAFNSVHQNMFGKMADAKVVDDAVHSILGDSFDYSNEEKVRDFRVRKLHTRCFSKWRRMCAINKKIRALNERLMCRSVIRKWQQFVARKKLEKLQLQVHQKLSVIRARSCIAKWRHFVALAQMKKKNKEKRNNFIAQKYFRIWWKKTNVMKWKILRLGDGFPAAPSRLSVAEQNEVWSFNCQGLRCSYSRLHQLEENLKLEKEKSAMCENLSAGICSSPLPIQVAFQRLIDSRTVPNTSKPKFYTLVICFLNDVDEYVINWLRKKLNPVSNGNPVSINCSFKLSSMTTHSYHVVQFVEARLTNISKISGISSVLYVSNEAKDAASSNFPKVGTSSPNSKTFVLNKKECSSPSTSLGLMNTLLELYKNSAPLRGLHNTTLSQITNSFICKHVFDVALQTERHCTEIGQAPLPPQCYHLLYERALLHLKEVLLDRRLRNMQWRALCPETHEPVIREMSESLHWAIADALEQCQLSPVPSSSWTSWSEALKGLVAFVKREFDVRPSSPEVGLIENISFIVLRAKQFVMSTFSGIDHEALPSTLLLPWKDIYVSLITHKLHKLPDIDVICFSEDLEKYNNDNDWFLPHLAPLKSLHSLLHASKRKVQSDADEALCKPKKTKRDTSSSSLFDEELKITESLEKRVKAMLDDGDRPIASLFENSNLDALEQVAEPNPDDVLESDTCLLNCISQEKLRFDALEEKLLKMIN